MPVTSEIKNSTRKTINRIFAIPAEAAATPPKPKKPATSAMIRKIAAQYSMTAPFKPEAQRLFVFTANHPDAGKRFSRNEVSGRCAAPDRRVDMRRALLWGGSSGDSRGRPQFTGAGVKDSASDFLGRMERELVGFTREIQELGLRCRQQQPHIRALLEDRLNDLGVRRTVLARNIERLRTCRSDAAELGALTEKSYRELAAALRTARKWLS